MACFYSAPLAWNLTGVDRWAAASAYTHFYLVAFAIDSLVWIGLLWNAQRSQRDWTIWTASLQGMTVLGHLARLVGPGMHKWVYYLSTSLWAWPIQALLLVALLPKRNQGRIRRA